ncbi:MAG: hypothetical protein GX594_13395 [Pirellulaceae bacterium]|nr:hypothetical protein [Pirellulaceae bacterium]
MPNPLRAVPANGASPPFPSAARLDLVLCQIQREDGTAADPLRIAVMP